MWFDRKVKAQIPGECHLVRYTDDFVCMEQNGAVARQLEGRLRERFKLFGLILHPEKIQTISFGRYEASRAERANRKANTFDFLGFTYYRSRSRKGNILLGRRTSRKKFCKACDSMNQGLKDIRNALPVKEWGGILTAKIRGHFQYYGVSGNWRIIYQYREIVRRMVCKWLDRRSQKRSMNWQQFTDYLKRYRLPAVRLAHSFYTEGWLNLQKSRVREIRTHGSVRGIAISHKI